MPEDEFQFAASVTNLALLIRQKHLAIYAGAGISAGGRTNLPTGSDAARLIAESLRTRNALPDCDAGDLKAVADAADTLPDGLALLQRTACDILPLRVALPSDPHEALALLIVDAALPVYTTNWDTCIERASGGVVSGVVTDQQRAATEGPVVLKVHGCATQPGSLLVSTKQLEQPPIWASEEVRARLAQSRFCFVGVGDVAAYVRTRIEQFVELLPPQEVSDRAYVVGRSIRDTWAASAWSEIVPQLPEERKVQLSSSQFFDRLVRAYVLLALDHARGALAALRAEHPALQGIGATQAALATDGAGLAILRFIVNSGFEWPLEQSVVHSEQWMDMFLALALLSQERGLAWEGTGFKTIVDQRTVIALASVRKPASSVRSEARRRAADIVARDRGANVMVVASGHLGKLTPKEHTVEDVVGFGDYTSIVDIPRNALELVDANELVGTL